LLTLAAHLAAMLFAAVNAQHGGDSLPLARKTALVELQGRQWFE
jgi:hypothetical protein